MLRLRFLSCSSKIVNRSLPRIGLNLVPASMDAAANQRYSWSEMLIEKYEKAIQRGHTYATIVSDTKHGVVFDVGEGRNKVSTKFMLAPLLGDQRQP